MERSKLQKILSGPKNVILCDCRVYKQGIDRFDTKQRKTTRKPWFTYKNHYLMNSSTHRPREEMKQANVLEFPNNNNTCPCLYVVSLK